jgi:hypothetical protein
MWRILARFLRFPGILPNFPDWCRFMEGSSAMENLDKQGKPVPLLLVGWVFGLVVMLGWLWAFLATSVAAISVVP